MPHVACYGLSQGLVGDTVGVYSLSCRVMERAACRSRTLLGVLTRTVPAPLGACGAPSFSSFPRPANFLRRWVPALGVSQKQGALILTPTSRALIVTERYAVGPLRTPTQKKTPIYGNSHWILMKQVELLTSSLPGA